MNDGNDNDNNVMVGEKERRAITTINQNAERNIRWLLKELRSGELLRNEKIKK